MRIFQLNLSFLLINLLSFVFSTSCKTTEDKSESELRGDIVKKMNKSNPYWTPKAKKRLFQEAKCSAFALQLVSLLDMKGYENLDQNIKAGKELNNLGLKTLRLTRYDPSLKNRIFKKFNPFAYLPKEENYAYIELQKHLYSLFQLQNKTYLESVTQKNSEQMLSDMTISDANKLRITTAHLLKYYGEFVPLSLMEALVLIYPFAGYNSNKAFALLSWVNYRDVMIADGRVGYAKRKEGAIISQSLAPVLPEEKDPAGQAYHFWGYASRRIGQGKALGQSVSQMMSYYYEQYKSKDNEDHFSDIAGVEFARAFIQIHEKTKSVRISTLRDQFKKEECFKYNLKNLAITERRPTAYCRVKVDLGNELKFPIFKSVSSLDDQDEALKECEKFAGMSLNKHLTPAPHKGARSAEYYLDITEDGSRTRGKRITYDELTEPFKNLL